MKKKYYLIALTVLIVSIILYLYSIIISNSGYQSVTDKAKDETCKKLLSQNPPCSDMTIRVEDWNPTGGPDNFQMFMADYYGCANTNVKQCIKKSCNCPYDYLCDNVSCDNYCSGDILYNGACNKGSCTYSSINCTYGCSDNICISDTMLVQSIGFDIVTAIYHPDKNYVNAVIRNTGVAKLYKDFIENIYINGYINYTQVNKLVENYTFSKPFISSGDVMDINITNVTTSCSDSTVIVVLKWGMETSRAIQCS